MHIDRSNRRSFDRDSGKTDGNGISGALGPRPVFAFEIANCERIDKVSLPHGETCLSKQRYSRTRSCWLSICLRNERE